MPFRCPHGMCPSASETPTPAAALETLRGWRLPTATTALSALSALRVQTQLLSLYHHYFPGQFAKSTASCARAQVAFSLREREFLNLVNHHLFPLEIEIMEEWVEEGDVGVYLSIVNPSCFEIDLAELSLPLQVMVALLAISDVDTWHVLRRAIGQRVPMPATVGDNRQINWQRLNALCRRQGALWRHLPLSLDIVAHATGNFWLDLDENNAGYERVEWDVAAVDYLAAEWRKARPLLKRFERVLDWLDHDARALATLVRLWNRASEAT